MLKEYALYVARVRGYTAAMKLEEAVRRTIKECIAEGILADFLRKNRAEVEMVSILEYDKEYESWKEIALNFSGSELAYSGMGRYHYNNAEYSKALEYFKMANTRKYYSVTVKKYIAQIGRNVHQFEI